MLGQRVCKKGDDVEIQPCSEDPNGKGRAASGRLGRIEKGGGVGAPNMAFGKARVYFGAL